MANINKIKLSGTTYDIQDPNASKTVELTQVQYDALAVKDPNTFYIITDATSGDLSNYYTKSETSGATQISTALASKQTTLTAGTGIDITDNVISVTGKVDTLTYETYTAATATAIGNKLATSDFNTYSGTVDTAINSKASQSDLNTLSGTVTAHTANTDIHVTTAQTASWDAKSDFSGSYNDLTDKPTIPTVPTSNTAFTNDAGYITSDAISGKADTSAVTESINAAVSGKVDTSTFNTYSGSVDTALSGKQDTLSAGTGIDITNDVISVSGVVMSSAVTSAVTSGSTDVVTSGGVYDQLGGMKIVKLTESEYAALVTKDSDTLYVVIPDPSN